MGIDTLLAELQGDFLGHAADLERDIEQFLGGAPLDGEVLREQERDVMNLGD